MTHITVFGLAAFAMTACGGRVEVQAHEDTSSSARAPDTTTVAASPFVAGSVWIGSYTCPQGLTELQLRIVEVSDGVIEDARFDFDFEGTSGSFHLSGQFDPDSNRATFRAGAWITRPRGDRYGAWHTVGMDGAVDEAGRTFEGQIVSTGCGGFRLVRAL